MHLKWWAIIDIFKANLSYPDMHTSLASEYNSKKMFPNWSKRPTTVPTGSDHYFHLCCLSVRPKTSKSSENHSGLAEWIIDDSCLVYFCTQQKTLLACQINFPRRLFKPLCNQPRMTYITQLFRNLCFLAFFDLFWRGRIFFLQETRSLLSNFSRKEYGTKHFAGLERIPLLRALTDIANFRIKMCFSLSNVM